MMSGTSISAGTPGSWWASHGRSGVAGSRVGLVGTSVVVIASSPRHTLRLRRISACRGHVAGDPPPERDPIDRLATQEPPRAGLEEPGVVTLRDRRGQRARDELRGADGVRDDEPGEVEMDRRTIRRLVRGR